MSEKLDLDTPPQGVLVQSKDGHIYFLPNHEMEQLAIPKEHVDVAKKLFAGSGSGGGLAHPDFSCGTLMNWLTHNNPNSMSWRKVSVMWMNQC